MDKNSSPRIYGVLGYPVKHSLSPSMHNAAFQALKINAEYRSFQVKPQDLENFLNSLAEKNIYGLNVTIPYKEKVMPFLQNLSPEADLIGAVNTIKVFPDKLEGFNTDGEGFLQHLRQDLKFDPQDKTIAILGAGGAARAISVYLSQNKPRLIAIYDIDKTKAEMLVKHLKENFKNVELKLANSIAQLNIGDCHLLINATPIGMKDSAPCIVDEKLLHNNLLVYDLIYNPPQTKLLAQAKKVGAKVSNGLGMLLYQGMLSFKIWIGQDAPLKIMRQALEKGL
jgi:shikimate dehydrogenase